MSDLSTLTASPEEFQLDGQTYKMRPLTLTDLGDFESWARRSIVTMAMGAGRELQGRDRRDLVNAAVRAASVITYDSPEAQGMMQGIHGAGQLLYLSLRHNHPDITHEQVISKLTCVRQFQELATQLMRVSAPSLSGDPVAEKPQEVVPGGGATSPSSS